jgi:hypothetical protein
MPFATVLHPRKLAPFLFAMRFISLLKLADVGVLIAQPSIRGGFLGSLDSRPHRSKPGDTGAPILWLSES